jgi:hypothetical protein
MSILRQKEFHDVCVIDSVRPELFSLNYYAPPGVGDPMKVVVRSFESEAQPRVICGVVAPKNGIVPVEAKAKQTHSICELLFHRLQNTTQLLIAQVNTEELERIV